MISQLLAISPAAIEAHIASIQAEAALIAASARVQGILEGADIAHLQGTDAFEGAFAALPAGVQIVYGRALDEKRVAHAAMTAARAAFGAAIGLPEQELSEEDWRRRERELGGRAGL